ncbi:MAG: type II toxin-antitoxin system HicB family antitoxin [Herpetosiphonaceae bacterium]|nr:type II toxin-antitoxin system HicB family antitoxin [Herpetosiphonaceae bacterium]
MTTTFTAVFTQDGDWWLGWIEELPGANAQERTLDEARKSLQEAVQSILEVNRDTTSQDIAGRPVIREPMAVER